MDCAVQSIGEPPNLSSAHFESLPLPGTALGSLKRIVRHQDTPPNPPHTACRLAIQVTQPLRSNPAPREARSPPPGHSAFPPSPSAAVAALASPHPAHRRMSLAHWTPAGRLRGRRGVGPSARCLVGHGGRGWRQLAAGVRARPNTARVRLAIHRCEPRRRSCRTQCLMSGQVFPQTLCQGEDVAATGSDMRQDLGDGGVICGCHALGDGWHLGCAGLRGHRVRHARRTGDSSLTTSRALDTVQGARVCPERVGRTDCTYLGFPMSVGNSCLPEARRVYSQREKVLGTKERCWNGRSLEPRSRLISRGFRCPVFRPLRTPRGEPLQSWSGTRLLQ